jgi:hypothetical protein
MEQILLTYAARLALQEAAKVDAAKVVDFAERRDEFERRRRKRAERRDEFERRRRKRAERRMRRERLR